MAAVDASIAAFPIAAKKPTGSFTGEQAIDALVNAKRLQSTLPLASAATLSAATALASASMNAGECISVAERESGTTAGGGVFLLVDAGSSGARPAALDGEIVHVGAAGLYLRRIHKEAFVDPRITASASVAVALSVARAVGRALTLTQGDYALTSTLVLDQEGDTLTIHPKARLVAASGFSGQSMVELGNYSSVPVQFIRVDGGGTLACAGNCARGITAVSACFSRIENVHIHGATRRMISVGSNSAVGTSYRVDIKNVLGIAQATTNHASSIAIYYEKATDCYLEDFTAVGYRVGLEIASNAYSIDLFKVHVWGRTEHGAMVAGFRIFGSASLAQCHADTPFDNIGVGGDLFGFYISGAVNAPSLKVFMNDDLPSDDRVYPFWFDGDTDSVITLARVEGGSASNRFKAFAGGDTTNNTIEQKMIGNAAAYVVAP